MGDPVTAGMTEEVVTTVVEIATVSVETGVEVLEMEVGFGVDVFGTGVDFGRFVFVGGFPEGLLLCCTSPTPDLACTGMERKLVSISIPISIDIGNHVNFDVVISN
jgi:hypothetical protein